MARSQRLIQFITPTGRPVIEPDVFGCIVDGDSVRFDYVTSRVELILLLVFMSLGAFSIFTVVAFFLFPQVRGSWLYWSVSTIVSLCVGGLFGKGYLVQHRWRLARKPALVYSRRTKKLELPRSDTSFDASQVAEVVIAQGHAPDDLMGIGIKHPSPITQIIVIPRQGEPILVLTIHSREFRYIRHLRQFSARSGIPVSVCELDPSSVPPRSVISELWRLF